MTEWRFNKNRLSDYRTQRLGNVWPDVTNTVIYPELLAYGVDAKEIRLEADESPFTEFTMASAPGASFEKAHIIVNPHKMLLAYPDAESTYVGLVHELAHLRQALEGELGSLPLKSAEEWISAHDERNAIRWSARQARHMGWSMKRLQGLFRSRYKHHEEKIIAAIIQEGEIGYKMHPKQTTIPLLQRRPVRVRSYRRRSLK